MDVPNPAPPSPLEPKPVAPLLPPVLTGTGALLWLWVLPIAILLLLNVQGYALIEGNMDARQRGNAHLLGEAGLVNLGVAIGLFVASRRRAARTSEAGGTLTIWHGVAAVAVQVAYLWLALSFSGSDLLPRTVTDWIYTTQRYQYNQFAFAMLPLFWGLVRVACARPAKGRGKALVVNLGLVIGAPVVLYALFMVLARVDRFFQVTSYLVAVLVISLGVLMFVALIRGLALGMRDFERWSATGERIAILVFALVLPMAGLLLNREIEFPNDFQAWEVYALTALNAVILLLASCWHERRPLLSLGLLCATLPFSLYFFMVFLPFLPLSILAVIAMGAGFLVLTPTVLLILHLSLLNKARRGSSGRRLAVGTVCFLLLPGFFTVRGLADKAALNAALDYVYSPAVHSGAITYDSSRTNLKRALANHRSYKNGIYYPLLSDYYSWLVFDNLVLPDNKLARLEQAFFGEAGTAEDADPVRRNRNSFWGDGSRRSVRDRNRMPQANPPSRDVAVDALTVSGMLADEGNAEATEATATVVTLKLTLSSRDSMSAEYVKKLPLPAGVYVNGFRLHINGQAVPGRVTEKKTALWVYSMIRDTERRDPGLLFYNAPDELELRVFPVVRGTPSVVEVDFLVPARLGAAELGAMTARAAKDPAVVLGQIGRAMSPRVARIVEAERGDAVAVGLEGAALPVVKREAYLHVIVDRSEANGFDGDLAAEVERLQARFKTTGTPRVTLANYEVKELTSPKDGLAGLPLRGGFVADLALAQALRTHRDVDLDRGAVKGLPPRPVFVILSKKALTTAKGLELEVSRAWRDVVPSLALYATDAGGAVETLSDRGEAPDAPVLRLGNSVRPWVRGFVTRFAASGSGGAGTDAGRGLSYWSPTDEGWRAVDGPTVESGERPWLKAWRAVDRVAVESGDRPWVNAVRLQVQQQDYDRSPGGGWVDLKTLVAASQKSGVMLPSTSYIVVENAAQWRMIDVSERKKLDQNAALAFKEAPAPTWVWLGAGVGLWVTLRWWWRGRRGAVRVTMGS